MLVSTYLDDDAPGSGWRLRWVRFRNRLLASAGFQRLAFRLPLVRHVARGHARALFDLTAGFVYAQTLAAFVEAGFDEALGDRPRAVESLAVGAQLPVAGAETLLKAAAALGLAESAAGGWVLGPRGAMLRATAGVVEMIAHHRLLYADLADPLAMLRREGQGQLAQLWAYGDSAPARAVADYSALMAASQPMVAAQALAAYDFACHRAMLDVGGGSGRFVERVAAAAPQLRLGLFDRPAVVAHARDRLTAAGLGERTSVHGGSFLTDVLPTGFDLVTLVRVLHDHDDAPAMALLRGIRAALPAGGRLLIVEPMADAPGARAMGHAYFGLYLAAMRSGRPRTAGEIAAMVAAAGFARSRQLSTPLPLVAGAMMAVA